MGKVDFTGTAEPRGEGLHLDVPNDEYHADTHAVSKSMLDMVHQSPSLLLWSRDAPVDEEAEQAEREAAAKPAEPEKPEPKAETQAAPAHPSKPGKKAVRVAAYFDLQVGPDTSDAEIEAECRRVFERAGIKTLSTVEVHRG